MSGALQLLEAAARDFDREEDDDFVDPKRLAAVVDRLQGKLCRVVHRAAKRGEHVLFGQSACTWVAKTCQMSRTAAADRLCVGEQLGNLPQVAEALSSGEIGYQASAVICHLSEQLGEKRDHIEEQDWIGFARRFSIKELRFLTYRARETWDAEGFEKDSEEDYEQRCSTRRVQKHCAPPSRPSPSRSATTISVRPSSGGRTLWSSWSTTPWTRARCPGATGCGRTSMSTPRSKA